MNAATAAAAVAAGARLVNDVSGGLADPDMLRVVADAQVDIALGHWRGPSTDMYAHADYVDVGRDVSRPSSTRGSGPAVAAGIDPDRVVLDPGIGFGKRGVQNWQTLRAVPAIARAGSRVSWGPVASGFSPTRSAPTPTSPAATSRPPSPAPSPLARAPGRCACTTFRPPRTRSPSPALWEA